MPVATLEAHTKYSLLSCRNLKSSARRAQKSLHSRCANVEQLILCLGISARFVDFINGQAIILP